MPYFEPKSRIISSQVFSMNWNSPSAEEVAALLSAMKLDSLSASAIM
jgi:hypothetical protein